MTAPNARSGLAPAQNIARGLLLASLGFALLALAGCRWTSEAPLMPASAYDRSPIAPGEYQHERRTYNSYRVSRGANGAMLVEMFTMGTDPENPPNYVVRFDRLDDEFYLIQAVQTGGAGDGQIDYELIRIDAEGFTEVRVPCSAAFDQRIAVAAGASVRPDGDRECVFKSYEAVVAAAHGVAAELRRRGDTIGRYLRR